MARTVVSFNLFVCTLAHVVCLLYTSIFGAFVVQTGSVYFHQVPNVYAGLMLAHLSILGKDRAVQMFC